MIIASLALRTFALGLIILSAGDPETEVYPVGALHGAAKG